MQPCALYIPDRVAYKSKNDPYITVALKFYKALLSLAKGLFTS